MFKPIFSGDYSANTYLVGGGSLAVVDVGFQFKRVENEILELQYTHSSFINTHIHFDHACDCHLLCGLGFDCMIHQDEAAYMEDGSGDASLAGLFGGRFNPVSVDRRLCNGDLIDLDGVVLEVLHTPGHSPGSICLYEPDSRILITGDTVFASGVGRTDLFGGDSDALRDSVERLVGFCDKRGVDEIFPGHGPSASVDCVERNFETYFQGFGASDF